MEFCHFFIVYGSLFCSLKASRRISLSENAFGEDEQSAANNFDGHRVDFGHGNGYLGIWRRFRYMCSVFF